MGSDDKTNISRRGFHRLAASAAASAASASVVAAAENPVDHRRSQAQRDAPYDVVIVGAGCAGALTAAVLARTGFRVCVLEAGKSVRHPADHVGTFYADNEKIPESPWPADKRADRPRVLDMAFNFNVSENGELTSDWLRKKHYLIQHGHKVENKSDESYLPFNSTYERIGGGTLNHWLGTCLRFTPNDFNLKSAYAANAPTASEFFKNAADWPIGYNDLEQWYCKAEDEVGVAGDSEGYKNYLGASRSQPYPMPPIPLSYLDKQFKDKIGKKKIIDRQLNVIATPQARNSVDRDGRPKCQGNSSCVPICPIQAKYDATVHLNQAKAAGAVIQFQSVAYRVEVDEKDNNRISRILYKRWADGEPVKEKEEVTAKFYILASNAMETAKLLLISPWKKSENTASNYTCVANSSGQVGKNLMDHIVYLAWGVAAEPVYPYRGPLSTAGIGDFRDGPNGIIDEDRKMRAAYRIHIANDSWNWPVPPTQNLANVVNKLIDERIVNLLDDSVATDKILPEDKTKILEKLNITQRDRLLTKSMMHQGGEYDSNVTEPFGKRLKSYLHDSMIRHVRVGAELEALPLEDSKVMVSDQVRLDGSFADVPSIEKDALGIPKPQVQYRISEYTKKGFAEAAETLDSILRMMGVQTVHAKSAPSESEIAAQPDGPPPRYLPSINSVSPAVFTYGSKKYEYSGAGHIMGTYRMGSNPEESVCDQDCRSWDHENLYLLGSGVFPSSGTANPTLTIMALALRAADKISTELKP